MAPNQLRMGMYIARLDRPWLESPFLFQGFPLTTLPELEQLRSLCDYVYVDMRKSKFMRQAAGTETLESIQVQQYKDSAVVENEVSCAYRSYQDLATELDRVMRQARIFGEANVRSIRPFIKSCAESIVRNSSAMIWLSHMQEHDSTTAAHGARVAMLSMVVGRHLGLPRQQMETLGLCGLLHDVGKTRLDPALLQKKGDLPPEELRERRLHTAYGRDRLLHDPLLPQVVIETAFSHHERIDGAGYPSGIAAETLSYQTRLVSIVDCYDALTQDESMTSGEALKIIYKERGQQFDRSLVVQFIEAMGLYPPGSLVEMNTGEVGIVLSTDPAARLQPKIALVLDHAKKPMQQYVVNLQTIRRDKFDLRIKSLLRNGSYGVSLESFTRQNLGL